MIEDGSFERNGKGIIIKGNIMPSKVSEYQKSDKFFKLDDVEFEAYTPRKISPNLGELKIDLKDLEDKSILSMSEEDLAFSIQTNSECNKILYINKAYPRKVVQKSEYHKYESIRLSIEFSEHVPARVYFEYVSHPIYAYTMPVKMCFQCQRYDHSSISCKRKEVCGKCAGDHSHSTCTITDPKLFKCATCLGNHKSTSTTCPFYERALHISGRVQKGEISNVAASKMYANLYSTDDTESVYSEEGNPGPSPFSTIPPSASLSLSSSPHSPLSPSPVIKTTKRFPPLPKPRNLIPETQETTASSSTGPLSSLLLEDTDNTYIAPAQKKTKTQQQTKTPFHKTSTYAGILNGSLWTVNEDSQTQEEQSGAVADTGTNIEQEANTGANIEQEDDGVPSLSSLPPLTLTGNTPPTPQHHETKSDNIFCGFFKKILSKIAEWIKEKISDLLGDGSCSSFVKDLVTSFFTMLE